MLREMTTPFDLDKRQAHSTETAEASRLKREQREADVKFVMGNPQGRRFVHRLLAMAGVYQSSMRDGLEMVAYNEGRRDAGLRVLGEVSSVHPEAYLKMLKENSRADA